MPLYEMHLTALSHCNKIQPFFTTSINCGVRKETCMDQKKKMWLTTILRQEKLQRLVYLAAFRTGLKKSVLQKEHFCHSDFVLKSSIYPVSNLIPNRQIISVPIYMLDCSPFSWVFTCSTLDCSKAHLPSLASALTRHQLSLTCKFLFKPILKHPSKDL